jgi:hypothetical protein
MNKLAGTLLRLLFVLTVALITAALLRSSL